MPGNPPERRAAHPLCKGLRVGHKQVWQGLGPVWGRHGEGCVQQGGSGYKGAAGPAPASNDLARWPFLPCLRTGKLLWPQQLWLQASCKLCQTQLPTPCHRAASDCLTLPDPAPGLPHGCLQILAPSPQAPSRRPYATLHPDLLVSSTVPPLAFFLCPPQL